MTDPTPPTCFSTTVAHCLAAARTLSHADQLRLAAELIAGLPRSAFTSASLDLGHDAAGYQLVLDCGGEKSTYLYAEGNAIDLSRVTIAGVRIEGASYPGRDMTDAEREQLAGEKQAHVHVEAVSP